MKLNLIVFAGHRFSALYKQIFDYSWYRLYYIRNASLLYNIPIPTDMVPDFDNDNNRIFSSNGIL